MGGCRRGVYGQRLVVIGEVKLLNESRPVMRTLGWLVALLLNGVVVAAFASSAFEPGAPAKARAIGAAVAFLFLAIAALLLLARLSRLPAWGSRAMGGLCCSLPVLWLLGSLDHGILSGHEVLSVLFVSLFAWGTWRAFKLFAPRA